jgi:hypothetical protein
VCRCDRKEVRFIRSQWMIVDFLAFPKLRKHYHDHTSSTLPTTTAIPSLPTMLRTSPKRTICPRCSLHQQIRHASLIRRPKRPYTFTQLITLSDGSTFTHRTTSPQPIYRSTKDTKNTILWNPSSQRLLNVEEDEAGRLRRFRSRFGRGFDAESLEAEGEKVSH